MTRIINPTTEKTSVQASLDPQFLMIQEIVPVWTESKDRTIPYLNHLYVLLSIVLGQEIIE
jgi:hypothetical protein